MTYAAWTALSALRSGSPVKSRKQVYNLLENTEFSVLRLQTQLPVSQEEFSRWHKHTILRFCQVEKELCVGWAAKILNVFLKTAAYVGDLGRPGLVELIHPPIDTGLWDGLERRFKDSRDDLLAKTHIVRRIKAIEDYETYQTIIDGCRDAADDLGCLLIEVEQLWDSGLHFGKAGSKI